MYGLRVAIVAVLLTLTLALPPGEAAPGKASKTDKCPVCGMFVAKYPDFMAQVVFADGTHLFFDGAKDMFKYYFSVKKYTATRNMSDIANIYVTDYYRLALIDGKRAWYVMGSDVFGPMGNELMPFAKKVDAMEFMKDHAGKTLLSFDEVTLDIIKRLD